MNTDKEGITELDSSGDLLGRIAHDADDRTRLTPYP